MINIVIVTVCLLSIYLKNILCYVLVLNYLKLFKKKVEQPSIWTIRLHFLKKCVKILCFQQINCMIFFTTLFYSHISLRLALLALLPIHPPLLQALRPSLVQTKLWQQLPIIRKNY